MDIGIFCTRAGAARRSAVANSRAWSALIAIVGGLTACETPGESRIAVHAPEDATLIWDRILPTEEFTASAAPPDALRILGQDKCWDAVFLRDFDRQTGRQLRDLPIQSSDATGGGGPELDPPTRCADYAQERFTLSSGKTVDICWFRPGDQILIVMDVETGTEHVRISLMGASDVKRFGDQMLVLSPYEHHIDMFALATGEALWSWMTPDEFTYVVGSDAERLYLWQEPTRETFALSLAEGAPIWQENLGCEWLSLTDGLLVCGETLRDSSCDE
jgi:hypothetical protein